MRKRQVYNRMLRAKGRRLVGTMRKLHWPKAVINITKRRYKI